MRKRIFIHIGTHKTGTSAIQNFLFRNREALSEKGFFYPLPGNKPGHHPIAGEFRPSSPKKYLRKKMKTLSYIQEIHTHNLDTSILSAEGLTSRGTDVRKLREIIPGDLDVKIIIYLRRQDERLESGYNQIVKGSTRSTKKFLDSGSIPNKKYILDYYEILTPWRDEFGQENIIVRVYEKEQLPHGIIVDFCSVIGLEPDHKFKISEVTINPSLEWDIIEIIRLCNEKYKGDMKFHNWLVMNLERIKRGETKGNQHLLSPQQRRDLIEEYAESNAKVAREYLGREDGRLFYAPLPKPDEPWQPYSGLTVEQCIPILTQMLYNLDIKNRTKTRNFFYKILHYQTFCSAKVGPIIGRFFSKNS
jgi:hypothetical protein